MLLVIIFFIGQINVPRVAALQIQCRTIQNSRLKSTSNLWIDVSSFREYLAFIQKNYTLRNEWLNELVWAHEARDEKESGKYQFLGLTLCGVCIAACIGCCPKTIYRAQEKKKKVWLYFTFYCLGQRVKRKAGSGQRLPVKRKDSR